MDKLSIARLEDLIEQTQESLEQVLHIRVSVAKNTIQIYTLLERLHVALIQEGINDTTFLDIILNTEVNESVDSTMESILQEINELITKFYE